jgi:hypothetical protein
MTSIDLRSPIERFEPPRLVDAQLCSVLVEQIVSSPSELHRAVAGLTDRQLGTTYRDGGWTVRQVAHHPGEPFERRFRHPELAVMSLDEQLAQYAWHGRHHVTCITTFRTRMDWA